MKSTRLSLKQILAIGPIYGAADGDGASGAGGTGGAGTDPPEDGDKGGTGGAAGDAGAGGEDKSGGDPQKKIVALTEEKDRHFVARQAAEKERDELRKTVAEAERLTKTKEENLEADLKKANDAGVAKDAELQTLHLKIAFLQTNDVVWQNPERALASVDLSDVTIKDGVVDKAALSKAIKKLATDEPYMVKPKEEEGTGKTPPGKTGAPPAGGQPSKSDLTALQKKYPSLRSHV